MIALALAASGQENRPSERDAAIRARYEGLAAKVTVIDVSSLVYARPTDPFRDFGGAPEAALVAWVDARRDLEDRGVPVEPIIGLTKHPDPKVRTLAALALFAREDASLVPHIAPLCVDEAESFAWPQRYSRRTKEDPGPPPKSMQVRWVAIELVGFWTNLVGGRVDRFAEYWAPRKDRPYLASSFVVRLKRASQGTLPLDRSCIEPIKAVRRAIDSLPEPDRDWVLLWVCDLCWSYEPDDAVKHLATNDELVTAAKRLGAPKLMASLAGKVPFDDPDVAGGSAEPKLKNVILRNAAEVLRAEDFDALLEKASTGPDGTPLWVIAAAAVRPDRAQGLLEHALRTFKGHMPWDGAEIALGLWAILGEARMDVLVDWFFSETTNSAERPWSNNQTFFMTRLPGVHAPADRKLVARIVRDPRLDQLGEAELTYVILAVNRWASFGPIHVDRQRLSEWRERLCASVPRWENP
jgi:hypothetical protein